MAKIKSTKAPVDLSKLKGMPQGEQRIFLANAFKEALLWVPPEGEKFDIAKHVIIKRTLEEYRLVFTGTGSIHKKRPNMGRPFLDHNGLHANGPVDYYLSGDAKEIKKVSTFDQIKASPGFENFRDEALNIKPIALTERIERDLANASQTPGSSLGICGSKRAVDTEEDQDDHPLKKLRLKPSEPTEVGPEDSEDSSEDITEIERLQTELIKERNTRLNIEKELRETKKSLKTLAKDADGVEKRGGVLNRAAQDMIHSYARQRAELIKKLIQDTILQADILEVYFVGSADFLLLSYEKALKEARYKSGVNRFPIPKKPKSVEL